MKDINELASQLLERLANSIHDRKSAPCDFCFNATEKELVREWLHDTFKRVYQEINEY